LHDGKIEPFATNDLTEVAYATLSVIVVARFITAGGGLFAVLIRAKSRRLPQGE
jgi:hypothetical protein